ncbi:hypothetical protein SAMN04487846_1285 [Microbacterium sp. cf046]|uniref:hypothetical protein n=1 Tax=Microbacterium sp. cf046 TaxID=1761803 RepID=UPI0008DF5D9F|nr:hypothetical protein [Microbacterium sp. cf046]SFR99569.1 hypothetical protein SAMN04487846_1285 [Microbacterium sp. cf046]
MRWDGFFDDLEVQLASEWEAERAALDTEAERLRLSRVALRERLSMLQGRDRDVSPPSFDLADGTVLSAEVTGVGADWVALEGGRSGAIVVPFASIASIGLPHVDVLRSARPANASSTLANRMTLGFVARDLVRRRVAVAVHLMHGRVLAGTIDRAGHDHLDLAMHEPGTPRRASEVTGHRIVPFSAVAWIRLDAGAAPA